MNRPGIVSLLRRRADAFGIIRRFFVDRGFLEVDTPIRIPVPIPEANIVSEPAGDWYLQTSPEQLMKRLLAAGGGDLFQICHCFRRGERGRLHLPEFTMLEWYQSESGYQEVMATCSAMLRSLCRELGLGDSIVYQGQRIDLAGDWQRLSLSEAFRLWAGTTVEDALAADIFEEVLVTRVEPHLGMDRPTFLLDYPAALGSLARLRPDDPRYAERFELYVAGIELANGFSELADAAEQRRRFAAEAARMGPETRLPEKFLADLPAMGRAGGIALGLDRLLMILSDGQCIDDAIPFTPESL